jgi:5'-3' exoribonuclease 1
LIGFLVGNDFIPHLPDLHIKHEALPNLWRLYIETFPSMGGYMNENGNLNLPRFQIFMEALAVYEFKMFKDKYYDLKYLDSKRTGGGHPGKNKKKAIGSSRLDGAAVSPDSEEDLLDGFELLHLNDEQVDGQNAFSFHKHDRVSYSLSSTVIYLTV